MSDINSSGTFQTIRDLDTRFHDHKTLEIQGAGYAVLYSVVSGRRKLLLKAAKTENGKTAENLMRLQREYQLMELLVGNEHVVNLIGWRNDEKVGPCIVMEYVDGTTLDAFFASHPSIKERKRILEELLDAVDSLHTKQIIHNDLKPNNILITRVGHHVKLIDFGYADCDVQIDKATGGTLGYASPELSQQQTLNCSSDIYSLGFVIKALFPHRYGRVVRKCQRKKPEKRFQCISEVRNALVRSGHSRWCVIAVIAVASILLAWPKEEVGVSSSKQIDSIPQTITVSDTVLVNQSQHETVKMGNIQNDHENKSMTSQAKPEIVMQNHSATKDIPDNMATDLFFDSIFMACQEVYDRYERIIQEEMKNGIVSYWDYGEAYKDCFIMELEELYDLMKPTDLRMQTRCEIDFKVVSEDFISKFVGLYDGKLPSIGWVGQENPRKADSLRIEWQKFYFKIKNDCLKSKFRDLNKYQ